MMMPKRMRYGWSDLKRDIIALIVAAAALFLAAALWSYNPHDTSWFFYDSSLHAVHNVCGLVGAHSAALLFYFFGSASFVVVGLLFFIVYLILFRVSYAHEWDRLFAWGLLLAVGSTLCAFYTIDFWGAPFAGGLVGHAMYVSLVRVVELFGTGIFLHTLLLVCLIVLLRFSFMRVALAIGMPTVRFFTSKQRFVVPTYHAVHSGLRIAVMPLIVGMRFVRSLINGSVVTDDDYSLASFDRDLVQSDSDRSIQHDPFWHDVLKAGDEQEKRSLMRGALHDAAIRNDEHQPEHHYTQMRLDEQMLERAGTGCNSAPAQSHSGMHNDILKSTNVAYHLPRLTMFSIEAHDQPASKLKNELETRARILEEKLERFGVIGSVVSIKRGPVVTLFEYQPAIDTKVSKILALEDDLALALQALSIRIIAPIPGRAVVGLEVANKERQNVLFAQVITSKAFEEVSGALPLILGSDTVGEHVAIDLAQLPHLLIAGSTGSGKSMALNAMLMSLLCTLKPDELKLILIDPKRLEFAVYADIAHLLFPIITDVRRATLALRWLVQEMERRYERMAAVGARNIFDYQAMVMQDAALEAMSFIVVIIDELADIMVMAGADVEDLLIRITQMARAAGIHMIVATQRPSVDVLTGLIKVNFPSRISFRVTSKVDSRTILDCSGADKLLGRGDMLFLDGAGSCLRRVHGAYISRKEIDDVVAHIKAEQGVQYLDLAQELVDDVSPLLENDDVLYTDVLAFLESVDEVSISLLQRKFRIGYNRSARIIDMLESQGRIMPADGSKTRKIIR